MKHFTFIFALYLSLMSISPVIAAFGCMQNTEVCSLNCCGEKKTNSPSNCPFGICCTSCLFFHCEITQLKIIKIPVETKKMRSADEHIDSNYFAEAWRPPKMV